MCARKGTEGSNPSLSAENDSVRRGEAWKSRSLKAPGPREGKAAGIRAPPGAETGSGVRDVAAPALERSAGGLGSHLNGASERRSVPLARPLRTREPRPSPTCVGIRPPPGSRAHRAGGYGPGRRASRSTDVRLTIRTATRASPRRASNPSWTRRGPGGGGRCEARAMHLRWS
jgi:hypothetical protein